MGLRAEANANCVIPVATHPDGYGEEHMAIPCVAECVDDPCLMGLLAAGLNVVANNQFLEMLTRGSPSSWLIILNRLPTANTTSGLWVVSRHRRLRETYLPY